MCSWSRLSRGSKIMSLLDWFPEILRTFPRHACLCLSFSWFCRCPRPMATCVMTVSVSTLLAGRCGRNCLYLNWLSNQSLAKRSFWKGVLADSCCGLSLAMRSISVTYCKSVTNHACQDGRKSWLSLIGFRKFICASPCYMAMRVSLWSVPVVDVCLKVSLFCGCPR